MSTLATNTQIAREFLSSLGSAEKDKAAFRRYCSPDFLWENAGLPAARGYEAADAFIDDFAKKTGFSTTEIEILHLVADGDAVLSERIDRFYDAQHKLLFSVPILSRLRIANAKIVAFRDYFDATEVLRALAA